MKSFIFLPTLPDRRDWNQRHYTEATETSSTNPFLPHRLARSHSTVLQCPQVSSSVPLAYGIHRGVTGL
jgi:hypothetical protein